MRLKCLKNQSNDSENQGRLTNAWWIEFSRLFIDTFAMITWNGL